MMLVWRWNWKKDMDHPGVLVTRRLSTWARLGDVDAFQNRLPVLLLEGEWNRVTKLFVGRVV